MNLIILGPQGSGKGTQAEAIVKKLGLVYVEMGKILRSIANSDNTYANVVRETTLRGELVPDEYVRLIAWDIINRRHDSPGFIFDGYPRSLPQYEHLGDMLRKFGKRIDRVIFLGISEPESVRRLSARRVCGKCGEIYNLITNPPPGEGEKCKCGGALVQRPDDQPEAIKKRLEIFQEQTRPILEKAKEEGIAWEVDGERPIEVITQELLSKLESL